MADLQSENAQPRAIHADRRLKSTTSDEKPAKLPSNVDSGDIVLFNRKCSSMNPYGAGICYVAKFFSNSKWDHVGMVVRDPESKDSKDAYFLEADLGGVKMRKLSDRITKSKSHDIALRRLSVMRTEEFRRTLWNFAQEMTGRPYETGTGLLYAAHAVFDPLTNQERERLHALLHEKKEQLQEIEGELQNPVLTAFQRRTLIAERNRVNGNIEVLSDRLNEVIKSEPWRFKRQRKGDDLARVFCSELVGAAYQRLKLLESYPRADSYTPRDFSTDPRASLRLLDRVRLSKEEYLRRDDKIETLAEIGHGRDVDTGEAPSQESLAVLRKVLKRTPVENEIPDLYKRNEFINNFRAVVVDPGDIIFEQGEYGKQFYVLETGMVDRFIAKDGGEAMLVSTMGPHTSFGMTAFMYSIPRSSTIRARERSLLWTVDRPTFEHFRDERDVDQIKTSTDQRQLRTYLKDHFLFRRLDRLGPRELDMFFKVKFRAGENVFHQGDAHDNFYIIKSGECERHIAHPKSKDSLISGETTTDATNSLVKTLGPGESFGELGLMYNSRRSATIRARTDVECWAINAETFHRLHLGGGARYLQAVFQKYASVERDGLLFASADDFLRFANVDSFPEKDRDRLSKLLLALVTSNRKRDDTSPGDDLLIDFWEFVRFDIVLNQPNSELEFAFRLADKNNSGFIDAEEMISLLSQYKDIDKEAKEMSSSKHLSKLFGDDGSGVVSYKEYLTQPSNILPERFRQDIQFLADHMLHDLEAESAEVNDGDMEFVNVVDAYLYKPEKEELGQEMRMQMDLSHLLAVGISGGVARSVVAPLERLKILMQTDSLDPKKRMYNGLYGGLKTMWSNEKSLWGLFRGNGANVLRIVPTAIIQLAAVGMLHQQFSPLTVDDTNNRDAEAGGWRSPGAGQKVVIAGVAGIAAATVMYPLEFVRGRLSVQNAANSAYSGIFDGLTSSMKKDGVRSLYRGLFPSLLGVFPYVGVSYTAYDQLRRFFPKRHDGSGRPTFASAIICGAVASLSGQMLAFPMDTCRRRMQVDGFLNHGRPHRNLGLSEAFREVWQAQGLSGFYRGFMPNLLKIVPTTIVAFQMYEFVRTRIILERNLWVDPDSIPIRIASNTPSDTVSDEAPRKVSY